MDKNYLECLEHIIEIEKNCHTQEKLITSLNEKIKTLGLPKKINMPQKEYTYVPPVEYELVRVTETFDGEQISQLSYGGAILFGIIGGTIGYNTEALWTGIIGGIIIGAITGALFGFLKNFSDKSGARRANERAQKEAEKKADKLINEQSLIDEQRYQNDLKKYQLLVAFEKNRVALESEKKKELIYSREKLIQKHQETKELLARFYDFANIYETYRNIVAVCHIYEYLKSGICNQLTGHEGAYLVFKYEIYEKLKIEKLDTIISKLDQLHFDNITLNNTMQTISNKCDNLIAEVSNMRVAQAEAAQRNEALINNLGSRIDDAADRISYQNAVIAYNQECTTSELKQIKWLSTLERK